MSKYIIKKTSSSGIVRYATKNGGWSKHKNKAYIFNDKKAADLAAVIVGGETMKI